MPPLPGAGLPAVVSTSNPTLLPNFDPAVASAGGTLDYINPYKFAQSNPRSNATATITVSDTAINSGDTLSVAVTNNILKPINAGSNTVTVTVTVGGSDTATTLAEKIAKALNDNSVLQQFGAFADAAAAVVTLTWPGPIGNFSTVAGSHSGGATESLSPSSQSMSGGAGWIMPYDNFTFQFGTSAMQFWIGKPVILDYTSLSLLVSQAQPIA